MTQTTSSAPDSNAMEAHRPIVRELDKAFASVYGFGGMSVVGFALIPVATAWWQGWLAEIGTWVVVITFALIALYPLRGVVNHGRERLAERFRSYCQVNDLDFAAAVSYFEADEGYPYFASLFEERPGATASTDET